VSDRLRCRAATLSCLWGTTHRPESVNVESEALPALFAKLDVVLPEPAPTTDLNERQALPLGELIRASAT